MIPEAAQLANGAEVQVTRFIPLQLKRRGVEMRLVFQGEANDLPSRDPALLKAVARGYRWFNQLASGASADTLEIAKRERVGDNYVRRLIPPALLAPPLVEAICAGQQPVTLTAEKLRRRADISFDWQEQLQLIAGQ